MIDFTECIEELNNYNIVHLKNQIIMRQSCTGNTHIRKSPDDRN